MIRFVSFVFLVAMTLHANAQPRADDSLLERQGGTRIQVSLNFSMPLASADTDEVFKAQDAVRARLYAVADKECALLAQTIASVCRLETVNVNVNRQRQQNGDTISATLSMTLRVLLKP